MALIVLLIYVNTGDISGFDNSHLRSLVSYDIETDFIDNIPDDENDGKTLNYTFKRAL